MRSAAAIQSLDLFDHIVVFHRIKQRHLRQIHLVVMFWLRGLLFMAMIEEGGTTMIRIADNGCGIEREEVPSAFLRHSTSKIRSVDDLTRIGSLGFRGEALSSIAAVGSRQPVFK